MSNDVKGVNYISSGVAAVFTAMQTEHALQIISLIITILSVVVSLAFTFYKWYKEAKKDGKITKDEIQDLHKDVKEVIDDHKKDNKEE